jgi:hypothetical protein
MRGHSFPDTSPAAVSLVMLAALGCGSDSNAPSPPDVSGFYETADVVAVATCDPPSATEVLDAALGNGTFGTRLQITQQGRQITVRLLESHGQNVEAQNISASGTIDPDGAFSVQVEQSEQLTFLGGRTFFDQGTITSTGQFNTTANPVTFSSAGTSVQVFREGSSSGPVFATCTQSLTETGTRTS